MVKVLIADALSFDVNRSDIVFFWPPLDFIGVLFSIRVVGLLTSNLGSVDKHLHDSHVNLTCF